MTAQRIHPASPSVLWCQCTAGYVLHIGTDDSGEMDRQKRLKGPVAQLWRKTLPVQRLHRWKSRSIHKVDTSFGRLQCCQAALPTHVMRPRRFKDLGIIRPISASKRTCFHSVSVASIFHFPFTSFVETLIFPLTSWSHPVCIKKYRPFAGQTYTENGLFNTTVCFVATGFVWGLSNTIIILGSCKWVVQKSPANTLQCSTDEKVALHWSRSLSLSIINCFSHSIHTLVPSFRQTHK